MVKFPCTYDLVEPMYYLFVHVVKARNLPTKDINGCCDSQVEVKLGEHNGVTKIVEVSDNPEWNEVFAHRKTSIQFSIIELVVIDSDVGGDNVMGRVEIDLDKIQGVNNQFKDKSWYELKMGSGGGGGGGELKLAVWFGTQADEAFSQATHVDVPELSFEGLVNIRPMAYLSPKLWLVRVNVIEARKLIPTDETKSRQVYVKVVLGNQVLRTKIYKSETTWNEELVLVAAEPFIEPLVLSVQDKDEVLGRCVIPLLSSHKRLDGNHVNTQWISLEKGLVVDADADGDKERKVSSMIHLCICLDDGYSILDEATRNSHDFRPTDEQFWKPRIGILEVGILSAHGLRPITTTDACATTNVYCVAKYGQKWVRTRTIVDTLAPRWNEQYSWEVFDPYTLLTLGVFHNDGVNGGTEDLKIGKVKIRLSTLATDRVYTHTYPLILLPSSGLVKMGEIRLAIRFSCSSMIKMLHTYTQPLLPKSYYIHPLSVGQLSRLRLQATKIISMKLSHDEPPLREEVVEYMMDIDSNVWSLRRCKANFFRVMSAISMIIVVARWFDEICKWSKPIATILIQILCTLSILYPQLILPILFLYLSLVGIWNYRWRPIHPTSIDTQLSYAEAVHPDELDEEFDTFPTSSSTDVVRMRYDRLRSIAGRVQTVVGEVGVQGKRLEALVTWKDPTATKLFISICLIAAVVLSVTPFKYLCIFTSFYVLRHPRYRLKLPSNSFNYFRRLPGGLDSML